MTTPLSAWDCYHCGRRCGGRLPTGYRALTGEYTPDGQIHAVCSPDEPSAFPECWRRVVEYGEPVGALRHVAQPALPFGVQEIRSG